MTYRYGCDAYVVEPVISSGVTRGDCSETSRKHYKSGDLSQSCTSPLEALVAGKFAAKILLRFAFKRIGISATREQQQMPAYVHARVRKENRNAWSWGGITPRYVEQPINNPFELIQWNPRLFFKVCGIGDGGWWLDHFHSNATSVQTFCEVRSCYSPFISLK